LSSLVSITMRWMKKPSSIPSCTPAVPSHHHPKRPKPAAGLQSTTDPRRYMPLNPGACTTEAQSAAIDRGEDAKVSLLAWSSLLLLLLLLLLRRRQSGRARRERVCESVCVLQQQPQRSVGRLHSPSVGRSMEGATTRALDNSLRSRSHITITTSGRPLFVCVCVFKHSAEDRPAAARFCLPGWRGEAKGKEVAALGSGSSSRLTPTAAGCPLFLLPTKKKAKPWRPPDRTKQTLTPGLIVDVAGGALRGRSKLERELTHTARLIGLRRSYSHVASSRLRHVVLVVVVARRPPPLACFWSPPLHPG
jgi:hypothetical protein